MTPTSIITVGGGGVVVVTQVIPEDGGSIPLQTTPTNNETPPMVKQTTPTDQQAPPPVKMDDMTATFLRGEPQGLGTVQIFIGLLCVLFSLTAVYSPILIVHAPFCAAVTFVVSGSLAAAARRRTSYRLVLASLLLNVFSALLSLGGVACLCWLLAARSPSQQICGDDIFMDDKWQQCSRKLGPLDLILSGLRGMLLVLLVLQFCVVVTVCVFSGKAIRNHERYAPNVVMSGAASELGSDVALLDNEDEETSKSPPNCL